MSNLMADSASSNAEDSVSENFDDDVIFVSSTTPVVVDLCISPPDNPTNLRNQRFHHRTLLRASQVAVRSPTLRSSKRTVKTAKPPSPPKRNRIANSNIAGNGIHEIKCAVCLGNPLGNRASSTICGHIYCEPCIKMAIIKNKRCPLCKENLSMKSIHPIYF